MSVLLALSLGTLPALAAGNDANDANAMAERIQLNGTAAPAARLRVDQSIGEPLATAGPLPVQDALQADRPQTARQTMLWAEHRASGLGVGVGVEQRRPYGSAATLAMSQPQAPSAMEGGVLMGVSLATGPRSHLVVQTPLVSPAAPRFVAGDDPQLLQDQQRQVRMGLIFNTRKPMADLRQGFRMELSGQTTLAVKPRGGKIGLAVQKVW